MNRKTTQIAVVLASFGIVAGIAIHEAIPRLVDQEALKKSIEDGLHQSTGVNFKIKQLALEPTLFHGLQVNLNTSTITDMRKNPLGSIENITVQIRYLPLITERLPQIAKVHLNHVRIPIGSVNIFKEIKLKLTKPQSSGFLKPAEMHDTEILLTDYLIEDVKLASTTRRLLTTVKRFRVEGKDASIRHLESKKPVSVLATGLLTYLIANPATKPLDSQTISSYRTFIEVPQAAIKKGALSAEALGRLELKLQGSDLNLDLNYEHKAEQNGQGTVSTHSLNLHQGQLVALQLVDTLGVPLPKELGHYFFTGKTTLENNRFQIDFSQPAPELASLEGKAQVHNLAISQASHWPVAMLDRMNGDLLFKGREIQIDRLNFYIQNLPLRLVGRYNLDSEKIQARLTGKKLRLTSLRKTVAQLANTADPLQGRNLTGLLDFEAQVAGTAKKPVYQGKLTIQDGNFEDASQGLMVSRINGQLNFEGAGLQNPMLRYYGKFQANNGKLIIEKQGLRVNRFDGKIALSGRISPNSKSLALPNYEGQVNVRDAQYQDPQTGLLVAGIRGVLRLGGQLIRLENFRGMLGGSEFLANGTLTPKLAHPMQSQYAIRVHSNQINLKRFKEEALAKIPQTQAIMAQLKPYSGSAKLDVTANTGFRLKGKIDVADLGIRTAQSPTPLRVPRLSVIFDEKTATVPATRIYYGDLGIQLAGRLQQPGKYRFQVDSDPIPVSFLRDQQKTLNAISGAALPEIWNTSGRFAAHGVFSNQGANPDTSFTLDFYDAGLSWRGADFPVYGLNGSLLYQQDGKAKPIISSQNLNFRYGNSAMKVAADNHTRFSAKAEGLLSALTVNHFLVSHQTDATPYREIPFNVTANGVLAGLPNSPKANGNDLQMELFLDLNPNLKSGYSDQPLTNENSSSPDLNTVETVETSAKNKKILTLNPLHAVQGVLGVAKQSVQSGLDLLRRPLPGSSREIASQNPPANPQSLPLAVEPQAQLANQQEDNSNASLSALIHWKGPNLKLEKGNLHLFDGGNILAEGDFQNFLEIGKRAFLVHVVTSPEVDLAKLSQGAGQNKFFKNATGKISGDLQFGANSADVKLGSGWINADNVVVPYLTLRNISGKVNINGETGTAEIAKFEIPGVDASVTARSENIFEIPVTLEDVKIKSNLISIDSLNDFNSEIIRPILVDQLAHSLLRPWQQGDPTIPIQFRKAHLAVGEVIFQNIIMNNLTSELSLYANSRIELNNTKLKAAGGIAQGDLSMSPNDYNFMTLELNVDKVKANALTKALLNTTNQIFGDVSGTVQFTTFGENDVQMQQNANGTVKMKVANGRLPAIAKVETLLTTANILRGGLLGLNLNNLFRSLMFYDTNYFAELSGDMLIARQVLYTENLKSDGVNLDLLIQGTLRMDNGNADMLVNGQMSQDVAGLFGPLGQLSLSRVVRYIPGIGTLGKNKAGLLGYVPGVGYVPGLGGPAGNFSKFQVQLDGSLEDPSAIRNFDWVR